MFKISDFPLPFREKEMEPFLSETAIKLHYYRHMATYITNLNNLIADTKYANMDLQEIIKESVHDEKATKIFNNAAQIYNHEFFFNCLGRGQTLVPDIIADAFGGIAEFKEKFKHVANEVFGSGWVWLIRNEGKLEITRTSNADTPIAHEHFPILTLDLWEHAYYTDWQNRRSEYIDAFLDNLIDWKYVLENLEM